MLGAHDTWIGQLLSGPAPAETKSDCSNCVMCRPAESAEPNLQYFDASVRCCSYEPALPNFIVGRILSDDDPQAAAGRASIQRRMARRVDIVPWGIRSTRQFATIYASHSSALFGRAPAIACPHLQEGTFGCAIWQQRPGVCGTWYCKHDRGKVGARFWNHLGRLLREVETLVGAWCVAEVHGGLAAMEQSLSPDDGAASPADFGAAMDQAQYNTIWGDWSGDEAAFYVACSSRADDLSWTDVERIGGIRLQTLAAVTRESYQRAVDDRIPERVEVSPFRVLNSSSGTRIVETYSPFNPVRMPEQLFRLLPYFDGRHSSEILEDIRMKENVRVQPSLVRRLVDFDILQEKR
jgi:hypothetical protein